jgi:hypothetical protein
MGMNMKAFWDFVQSAAPWLYVPIIGVISGGVAAAHTPLLGWRFEREKLKYANRKEFIATARSELAKLDKKAFMGSEIFARLRPHLSQVTMDSLNRASNSIVVVRVGAGDGRIVGYAEAVYRDIAALEQKWNLI